jgi:hypothetical protein
MAATPTKAAIVIPTIVPADMCFVEPSDPGDEGCRLPEFVLLLGPFEVLELCGFVAGVFVPAGGFDGGEVLPLPSAIGDCGFGEAVFDGELLLFVSDDGGLPVGSAGEEFPDVSGGETWLVSRVEGLLVVGGGAGLFSSPPGQHCTSFGPGQWFGTKLLAQVLPVQRQEPFPEDVEQVETQHSIFAAPGQYPDTKAPPVHV